jgi:hypothetical protein
MRTKQPYPNLKQAEKKLGRALNDLLGQKFVKSNLVLRCDYNSDLTTVRHFISHEQDELQVVLTGNNLSKLCIEDRGLVRKRTPKSLSKHMAEFLKLVFKTRRRKIIELQARATVELKVRKRLKKISLSKRS